MKTSSKFFCCSVCCAVSAAILVLLAATFFLIVDWLLVTGSKKESALLEDNFDLWAQIPGIYDIQLIRRNYVYNCTNYEDVIYLGARPEFEEFGPYAYREYDNISDVVYGQSFAVPGSAESETFSAITGQFLQHIDYYSEEEHLSDGFLDTPIYQLNQAAQGAWWLGQHTDYWRVAITVLYTLVIDGLGRQVAEQGAWTVMQAADFFSEKRIRTTLLGGDDTVPDATVTAMKDDIYYGLGTFENLFRWNQLLDKYPAQNKQLIKNELRFYFGLTIAQVDTIEANWNSLYQSGLSTMFLTVPTNYQNDQGVAYWQWADAYLTESTYESPSVIYVTDTAVGYPEISFFRDEKLLKNVNPDNVARFQDVQFFRSKLDRTSNFEYLFSLDDGQGGDPLENSLFCVDTLKWLIELGEEAVDIIEDTTSELVLGEDWSELTTTLGLDQVEQTYLIWLWMKYGVALTGNREDEGGNLQVALLSQMSAPGIEYSVGKIEFELPVIVYAYQFLTAMYDSGSTCEDLYTSYGVADSTELANLCANATFDFSDPEQTSFALMNIFFNKDTYQAQYYQMMVELASEETVTAIFFTDDSAFLTNVLTEVMAPVKTHYADVCTLSVTSQTCSIRELAFEQWGFGGILANPLSSFPEYDTSVSQSYQRIFKQFSKLSYTPEYHYYVYRTGLSQPTLTSSLVWENLQVNRLYNIKPVQDIILDLDDSNPFNNQQTRRYIQFVTLEETFFGMFYYQTPREVIEGYYDPLIEYLSTIPVYMGGDSTTNPFMAVNLSPLTPGSDNAVGYFSGEDDYMKTRQQAIWLNRNYVSVKKFDYTSINQLEEIRYEPWAERVYLDGTDGNQVHPIITEDNVNDTVIWVSDLSRSGHFELQNITQDDDIYEGVKLFYVMLDHKLMWSKEYNPDNEKYYTNINGTANLSTSLGAPVFATKGHFYQIDNTELIPTVMDHSGAEIQAEREDDDTYLGVEEYSGLPLVVRQRLQMNFLVQNEDDYLFNFMQESTFMPLAFIKKESTFTQEQADDYLGDLYLATSLIIPVSIVLAVIGVLCVLLAIWFIYKYKAAHRREVLGISTKDYDTLGGTYMDSSAHPGKVNATSELDPSNSLK